MDTFMLSVSPQVVVVALFSLWLIGAAYMRRRHSNVHKLPLPTGSHWLWGHEKEIFVHAAGTRFTQWFNQLGPVVRYKGALLQPDIIGLADIRAIHHLLAENPYGYMKSPSIRPLVERLVGQGLVWAEGEQHKRQRKLLNPVFSPGHIRQMTDVVAESASITQHALEEFVEAQGGSATVNISEWTSSFSLDVICRVGFNHDTQNGKSREAREIQSAWREQVNTGFTLAAFYGQIFLRTFPFIGKLPLAYFEAQGRIKKVVAEIAWRLFKEASNSEDSKDKSLLGTIVRAKDNASVRLNMTEIIDNITTFVVGGHETTSGTLGMTLLQLAKNPLIQDRLREELLAFRGEPTYDDLMNPEVLPYLDAVVREGLRVHPAGVTTERVAIVDDVIPLGQPITTASGESIHEIRVRAGQVITLPVNSVNMLASVWIDGETFRPERWMDAGALPPKNKLLPGGYSNILTFSAGPRMCIGYRLALLEFKVLLVTFIRNFVFHDTGSQVETKFSGTAQSRVVGKEDEGVQLPIRMTMYHA